MQQNPLFELASLHTVKLTSNECNNKINPITFSASVELPKWSQPTSCHFNFFFFLKCGFEKWWTRFQTRMTTTQSVTPELIRDEEQKEKEANRKEWTSTRHFVLFHFCYWTMPSISFSPTLLLIKNHSPVAVCHQLMIWTAHFERSALKPLIHTRTHTDTFMHSHTESRKRHERSLQIFCSDMA